MARQLQGVGGLLHDGDAADDDAEGEGRAWCAAGGGSWGPAGGAGPLQVGSGPLQGAHFERTVGRHWTVAAQRKEPVEEKGTLMPPLEAWSLRLPPAARQDALHPE